MMEALIQTHEDYNELLDAVEFMMHEHGLVEIEPFHAFTPGLYTRTIKVPADTFLLSNIHKTEHQFIMSCGKIVIYTEDNGIIFYEAPFLGITMSGTRRLAKTVMPTTWTSIHATNIYPRNNSKGALREAIRLVEAELYDKHENLFLINSKSKLCQD